MENRIAKVARLPGAQRMVEVHAEVIRCWNRDYESMPEAHDAVRDAHETFVNWLVRDIEEFQSRFIVGRN